MSDMATNQSVSPEFSEAIAVRALGFLSGRRSEFDRCIAKSGLAAASFTKAPVERAIMVATLDYLLANEATLNAFAERVDVPPEFAYTARRLLSHA